jgi:hypothetical protein
MLVKSAAFVFVWGLASGTEVVEPVSADLQESVAATARRSFCWKRKLR